MRRTIWLKSARFRAGTVGAGLAAAGCVEISRRFRHASEAGSPGSSVGGAAGAGAASGGAIARNRSLQVRRDANWISRPASSASK